MNTVRTLLLLGLLIFVVLFSRERENHVGATALPNFVIVMSDDQDIASLGVMENLMAQPYGSWVSFSNFFANEAKCCPARAALLSGQYSRHHLVIGNGKGKFFNDDNTLATWLNDVGYQTGFIGKYFIGFPWTFGNNYKPPGWDFWHERNGSIQTHNNLAVDFINDHAPGDAPFFLALLHTAPHHIAKWQPECNGQNLHVPSDSPAYNEAGVSDKPLWVRQLSLLGQSTQNTWHTERVNSQCELLVIDNGIQAILEALAANGELENTVVIVTADNGFCWGSHRWLYKNAPYDCASNVPLFIRFPSAINRNETRLVSNVDLAPTIAELAGVTPGRVVDGRSFVPLLTNPDTTVWTEEVLLERNRGKVHERFFAIRDPFFMYAEYGNGDKELYDLTVDPFQLSSVHGHIAYQAIQQQLAVRLHELLEE